MIAAQYQHYYDYYLPSEPTMTTAKCVERSRVANKHSNFQSIRVTLLRNWSSATYVRSPYGVEAGRFWLGWRRAAAAMVKHRAPTTDDRRCGCMPAAAASECAADRHMAAESLVL